MKKANIVEARCDKSPFCPAKRACPTKAIEAKKNENKESGFFGLFRGAHLGYEVNAEKCTGCSVCLNYCPMGAIDIK